MAAYTVREDAWTQVTESGLLQVRGGAALIALSGTPAENAWWKLRNGDIIETSANVYVRAADNASCVVYVETP